MSKKRINILCTSVGNPAFPTLAEQLRRAAAYDFYIVGTDIRPEAPGLYLTDKSYLVARLSDPKFLDQLFKIVEDHKIQMLFPLSTIDQNFFSKHKKAFEAKGVTVVCSDDEAVHIANNKYNLYQFLREKSINPLRYDKIATETLTSLVDAYPRPFVIKKDEGAGGQGTYIIDDTPSSLREDDKKFYLPLSVLKHEAPTYVSGETIISEYLPGDEFSVDALSYKGKFFYAVIRKRHKSVGGLALESTVVEEPEVLALSKKIVESIGLSYINNLQFKRSLTGECKMMEINPRVPGTIKLSLAAGADIIIDAIRIADGAREIPAPNIIYGTSIYRYWDGVIATPELINGLTKL